ncbi:hypothetical protein SteCoe_16270 [Stentor coeruleus]|uniref:Microbial-type PARG catalytic domain-containing protein n=1 Tax=Stentor coeruleus TaxID=5963 RepID=A0A1R2C1S7_9CILI|nr:hypothetical protein SteCoe_16270 [Stentor coeruleus]
MESLYEESVKNLSSFSDIQRRSYRIKIFKETLSLLSNNFYKNSENIKIQIRNDQAVSGIQNNIKILNIEYPSIENLIQTKISVINSDCLDVAIYMKTKGLNPIVLNMANNSIPGGGVKAGAGAQEESIFRRSNYVEHLNPNMYPIDGGIYSPDVVVFRESEALDYKMMKEPVNLAMVAVAALRRPNIMKVDGKDQYLNADKELMRYKIRVILTVAAKFNHNCLVLSALGCGAYKNPPELVAEIFKEQIESPSFAGCFQHIVFSIFNDHNSPSGGNFLPFARVFETQPLYSLQDLS